MTNRFSTSQLWQKLLRTESLGSRPIRAVPTS
jgi:hypothetical protein